MKLNNRRGIYFNRNRIAAHSAGDRLQEPQSTGGEASASPSTEKLAGRRKVEGPLANTGVQSWILCAIIAAAAAYLFQRFLPTGPFWEGSFIPDIEQFAGIFDRHEVKNIDFDANFSSSPGLFWLYTITWSWSPISTIIINVTLLLGAFVGICDIFPNSRTACRIGCAAILLNGYVLLAITGPNKDIPVLVLTVFIVRAIVQKPRLWTLQAFGLSCITYMFRDGYGLILAGVTIIFTLFRQRQRVRIAFWVLSLFLVSISARLLETIPAVARNREVRENVLAVGASRETNVLGLSTDSGSGVPRDLLNFIHRATYNVAGLVLYPEFITVNQKLFVLGIAYWTCGILILIAVSGALISLLRAVRSRVRQSNDFIVAELTVILWLAISCSSFPHPRYLLPVTPIGLGLLVATRLRPKVLLGFLASLVVLVWMTYVLRGVTVFHRANGFIENTTYILSADRR